MASGWVTNGPEVAAFEMEFAAEVGAPSGVAVSSGGSALELALVSLALPWGSRVLVSAPDHMALPRPSCRLVSSAPWTIVDDRHADAGDRGRAALRAALGDHPAQAMVVTHPSGDPADVAVLREAAGLPSERAAEDPQRRSAEPRCVARGCRGDRLPRFYWSANLPVGQAGWSRPSTPPSWNASGRHVSEGGPNGHGDPSERVPAVARPARRWPRCEPHRSECGDRAVPAGAPGVVAAATRPLAERYDDRLADIPGVAPPHDPRPGPVSTPGTTTRCGSSTRPFGGMPSTAPSARPASDRPAPGTALPGGRRPGPV